MNLGDFLWLAQRYSDLGQQAQGQFQAVARGEAFANQSGKALVDIASLLDDVEALSRDTTLRAETIQLRDAIHDYLVAPDEVVITSQ